jgi:hypothetical protein
MTCPHGSRWPIPADQVWQQVVLPKRHGPGFDGAQGVGAQRILPVDFADLARLIINF